jgi:hypothetical protein
MYLEDRTVRLQLWDTAGQVKKNRALYECKQVIDGFDRNVFEV